MSLFPAYSTPMPDITKLETAIESPQNESNEVRSSEEEALLLVSDAPDVADRPVHKKDKKKRKKSSKEKLKLKAEELHSLVNAKDDFYIDSKIDYGNLRVSTLYNPARPKYDRGKLFLGPRSGSRREGKAARYYITSLWNREDDQADPDEKSSKKRKKNSKDFIVITDSGKQWNGQEVEQSLLSKTAEFSKYLENNPYDVDMWLAYVKFQEERMAYDISNKNIASVTTARNNCYEKQLSILDAALKHNFNSMKLIYKKVNLSEQSLTNDKYLAMLKNLITTPELSTNLLIRGWFWYLDAIKYSMALCSVPSVKEVYIGAIKALHKAQKQSYQATHVDVTYRLGLFLRQAGLWEQLWMLLKLNLETNLAVSRSGGSFDFEASPIDVDAMLDEEHTIMNTGLPMHEVWSRIELVRSRVQWLPAAEEADDPQRNVFSTDFADFIKPISNKSHMFVLTVQMLRLLKIPLIPHTSQMSNILNVSGFAIDWELDCIETSLPFFYHMITDMGTLDTNRLKIMTKIFKDFAQEPNYTDMSADYFKFVNSVMTRCSQWFEGNQKTALLVWWIRFLQTLLAIHISIHSYNDSTKSVINSIKKAVKDVLKSNRDDIIIFTEFSILETQISGIEKGAAIMEACLQALPNEKNISRVHLVKTYVELMLRDQSKMDNAVSKCVMTLVALATDVSLFNHATVQEEHVEKALQKYSEHTDRMLLEVANYDKEIQLVDCMLPDLTAQWICCHGWLVLLAGDSDDLSKFCKRILAATFVISGETNHRDSRRRLQIREAFFQWAVCASVPYPRMNEVMPEHVLEQALEAFQHSSYIVWHLTGVLNQRPTSRWRLMKLLKNDEPSPLVALALTLHNFINLYKKYDPLYGDVWQPGHNNRLLSLLTTIVENPILKKSALIWHMLIEFVACHTEESTTLTKKYLYQALDECPWHKELYFIGCVRVPSEFSELIDIMVEKQVRLHAMPEELHL